MSKTELLPVEGFQGLYVLTPAVYGDDRGSFSEVFNLKDLENAGLPFRFVQVNQIFSRKGALRGMHFQRRFPQAKLIREISYTEAQEKHLGVMDNTAAALALNSHMPMRVFNLNSPENTKKAVLGENIGTVVKY